MTGLFRLVLLFLIVLVLVSVVRSVMAPSKPDRRTGRGPQAGRVRSARSAKLFKDPVCGTYVTSDDSPTASHDGKLLYFCSEDCRQKFLKSA